MPLLLLFKSGDGINTYQTINTSSGMQAVQGILDRTGVSQLQGILQSISDRVQAVHGIKLTLSDDPVQGLQELLLEISEKDTIQSLHTILLSIGDIDSNLQDVDWEIYLDGRSIKSQITEANVTYDEASVHNQFTCSSIDRNLFWRADPYDLSGESRIEVHIGARILYFLLEDKKGNEVEFNLWGRSISARDDEPHSDNIDFSLSSPMSARAAAESMIFYNVVDWQVPDWTLPSYFEFNGSRINGVREIASSIGAIVRCQDDGTLQVRKLWPTRPVNMPTDSPDVDYERLDNLINLQYSVERGEGFNEVEVYGQAPDLIMPDLYLDEDSPCVGDQVHIHAHWKEEPPAIVDTYVTSGLITLLGSAFETITETVVFDGSRGSVAKPIYDVITSGWLGSSAGAISFTQYEKEFVSEGTYGVANIIYRSKYQIYRLSAHSVTTLLAALIVEGAPGSSVKVQILDGGMAAPPVEDGNLTSDPIAVEAGTAFLDRTSYDKRVLALRVPYLADAIDGALASVTNQEIGISGNFKIRQVNIIFEGPQVVEQIEVAQCQLS